MAKRRLSMRKIEKVLRLKWGHDLSNRQSAKSCLVSHSTVREYLDRARVAGLSWPLDPTLDHVTLENMLFPEKVPPPFRPAHDAPHGLYFQGAEEEGGHPPTSMVRVQTGQPRRVSVQPVLPSLSPILISCVHQKPMKTVSKFIRKLLKLKYVLSVLLAE